MASTIKLKRSVVSNRIPELTFGELALNSADKMLYVCFGTETLALHIPSITDATNTFVVTSQAQMLAVSPAYKGDICVRQDINKTYILTNNTPTSLSSWQELSASATAVELATTQVRRTTTLSLTTTAQAIAFDTVDNQNNSSVLEWLYTANTQILVKVTGLYLVQFSIECIDTTNASIDTFTLYKNGVALSNGSCSISTRSARALAAKTIPIQCNAGDYFQVYGIRSSSSGTGIVQTNAQFSIIRLEGMQGQAGAALNPTVSIFADMLDSPISDFPSVISAPVVNDLIRASIPVRVFDDSTEEGASFKIKIPSGISNIHVKLLWRSVTAPSSQVYAMWKLYARPITIGAAVPTTWSSVTQTEACTTTTNFQENTFNATLSSLSLIDGQFAIFEVTRVGSNAADTLVGDAALAGIEVSFT